MCITSTREFNNIRFILSFDAEFTFSRFIEQNRIGFLHKQNGCTGNLCKGQKFCELIASKNSLCPFIFAFQSYTLQLQGEWSWGGTRVADLSIERTCTRQ